jgi:hypothetical protein
MLTKRSHTRETLRPLCSRIKLGRSPKLRAQVHCGLVIRESTVRNEAEQVREARKSELISHGAAIARPGLTGARAGSQA